MALREITEEFQKSLEKVKKEYGNNMAKILQDYLQECNNNYSLEEQEKVIKALNKDNILIIADLILYITLQDLSFDK